MAAILSILAQMHPDKLGNDTPPLQIEYSEGLTWVIAAVLLVGILLVTFKTSKRNRLERE